MKERRKELREIGRPCHKRVFNTISSRVAYSVLIYFSCPYLTIPGGLAFDLLFLPTDLLSSQVFDGLKEIASLRLLGFAIAIINLVSFATVLKIGPSICGLSLPRVECMSPRTAMCYLISFFLLWVALLALAVTLGSTGSATALTTYGLASIAPLIRVCIVAPRALQLFKTTT